MPTYTTVHTTHGLSLIAAAEAGGDVINLTHLAVGDGGGSSIVPSAGMTALVNERYRAVVNSVAVDPANPTNPIIEALIPFDVGGWTIREFGIFDSDGLLFAVGSFPDTYKSVPSDGSSNDLTVRIELVVSNASIINLVTDPSVTVASRAWVLSNVTRATLFPGGTTGQHLAKASNTNGDWVWVDPGSVNVIVDGIEEEQTIGAGQLTFNLSTLTTVGLAVYVDGMRITKQVGADGWQQGTSATQVVLGKQYTPGLKVLFVQNDPAGLVGQPLQAPNNLSDLTNAATARGNLGVPSVAEAQSYGVPPGTTAYSARSTPPAGWLVANGASLSRITYATLFAAIGTTYGAPDSSTFNLPDMRGVFVRGLDSGRGIDSGRALGSSQMDAIQNFTGQIGIDDTGVARTNGVFQAALTTTGGPGSTGQGGTVTLNLAAGGVRTAAETRPRNLALLPIIKY